MIQIYSIFRVTSTKVTPTLDTKQNEDTEKETSMVGVLVAIVSVFIFLLVAAVAGMYIYRRKRNALKGNFSEKDREYNASICIKY